MKNLDSLIKLDEQPFSSGATSKVYKGRLKKERYGLEKDSLLAVKVLEKEMLTDPNEKERIKNEYTIGQTISHQNLVQIYDLIEPRNDEDTYAIIMEFVDGKQLSTLILEENIYLEQKISISLDIANAVNLLHEKDILHRDIKADNILVDKSFQPKLVDYGVSKIVGNPTITPTSKFLGTLRFASPEAINGNRVGKGDDIYSLGAVLFELFTEKELFVEIENKALLVDAIRNTIPNVLGIKTSKDFPYFLRLLIYKMLSKQRNVRPKIEDVINWLSGKTSESYINELEDFHSQHYNKSQNIFLSEYSGAIAKCSECKQKTFIHLNSMEDADEPLWKAVEKYRSFFTVVLCRNCNRSTSCEVRHLNYNKMEKLLSSASNFGNDW